MTASAQRRRRATVAGSIAGLVGVVAIVAVSIVAVSTLRNSQEGRAPEVEERTSVSFPSTPNALIGVVDELDRLTSLAVLTLSPTGVGGSIVVIPVNADQTNSFGPNRLPISRQPYTPGDEDDAQSLLFELEPLLTLTIERVAVVGPVELEALVAPLGVVSVELDERVVDTDTPGSGLVVRDGMQELSSQELAAAFTAIDADGLSYEHHDVDVALWRGVAAAASSITVEAPLDDDGRPVAPDGFDDFWERFVGGAVDSRDLAIDLNAARTADNETDADFVVVDRRDALLVFGSISPGLVSKPNESLSFALNVGFGESQIAVLGDDARGFPISKTSMTRRFIAEMLVGQANIVAVDLSDQPGSIPPVTRIEVSDAAMEDDVRDVSQRFFGDAEIVVAATLTDGVDAVVTLGADFLVQREELLEIERAAAAQAAEEADVADEADFDVSIDLGDDVGDGDVDAENGAGESTDTVPVDE
ncbi:MAG: hypothetical protein AB8G14_03595 [Ilumatobacter sp.]